ncbi:hypothetical protein FI667_g14682, partial [Globisporangium splendens]
MEKSNVRGLSLRGSVYALSKTRPHRKKFPVKAVSKASSGSLSPSDSDSMLPAKITSADVLMKELRKIIHSLFSSLDPGIPTKNPRIDQEDLGEIDYATFSRRVFLPPRNFNFAAPQDPASDTESNGSQSPVLEPAKAQTRLATNPTQGIKIARPPTPSRSTQSNSPSSSPWKRPPSEKSPQMRSPRAPRTPNGEKSNITSARSPRALNGDGIALIYEHMTLDGIENYISQKIEERTPQAQIAFVKRFASSRNRKGNDIDLQEFCLRVLPPDYNGDGDYWSHPQNYHKQKHRGLLGYIKRTKNGLLMLPKFDELRRYTCGQYDSKTFDDLQKETQSSLFRTLQSDVAPSAESTRPASPAVKTSRPSTPRPQRPGSSSTSINTSLCGVPSDDGMSSSTLPSSPLNETRNGIGCASPRKLRVVSGDERGPRIEAIKASAGGSNATTDVSKTPTVVSSHVFSSISCKSLLATATVKLKRRLRETRWPSHRRI